MCRYHLLIRAARAERAARLAELTKESPDKHAVDHGYSDLPPVETEKRQSMESGQPPASEP